MPSPFNVILLTETRLRANSQPREKEKGSELFGHWECRFHDDSLLRDKNFTSTANKIYGYVTSRRKLQATVSEAEGKIDIFIEEPHTLRQNRSMKIIKLFGKFWIESYLEDYETVNRENFWLKL